MEAQGYDGARPALFVVVVVECFVSLFITGLLKLFLSPLACFERSGSVIIYSLGLSSQCVDGGGSSQAPVLYQIHNRGPTFLPLRDVAAAIGASSREVVVCSSRGWYC